MTMRLLHGVPLMPADWEYKALREKLWFPEVLAVGLLADAAQAAGGERYLDDDDKVPPDGTRGNAFVHCLWLCWLCERLGHEKAQYVGDVHEVSNAMDARKEAADRQRNGDEAGARAVIDNELRQSAADDLNNQFGLECCVAGKNCDKCCYGGEWALPAEPDDPPFPPRRGRGPDGPTTPPDPVPVPEAPTETPKDQRRGGQERKEDGTEEEGGEDRRRRQDEGEPQQPQPRHALLPPSDVSQYLAGHGITGEIHDKSEFLIRLSRASTLATPATVTALLNGDDPSPFQAGIR